MKSRRAFLSQALGASVAAAVGMNLVSAIAPGGAAADDGKNLMDAFSGESQANRKYLTFAEQADREGLEQTATMFRAIAAAETIHAMEHLRRAGKVGNTMNNLKEALAGETYEYTKMYPSMAREAAAEGKKDQESYYTWVGKVEEGHAKLYQKAIDANGKLAKVDYYLCPLCGYTHEGSLAGDCPVCHAPGSAFFKFA